MRPHRKGSGKNRSIIPTGAGGRRHAPEAGGMLLMQGHLGKHQCGQEAEERIRPWLLLGFPGGGKAGRSEQFRTG